MVYIQLLGILPAALILWFASQVRESDIEDQGARRWFRFLLITLAVLLVTLVITMPGLNGVTAIILMPVGCGVLAVILFHTFSDGTLWPKKKLKSLIFVLIGVALIILLGRILRDRFIPILFALVGLFIAFVWWAWEKSEKKYLLFGVIQILLLVISLWAADSNYQLIESPEWFSAFLHTTIFFFPSICISIAARLFFDLVSGDLSDQKSKFISGAILVLFTVFMLGYQMYLTSIWDVATDGLGAPSLVILVGTTSIATATLMAWLLPERRKLAALGFALLVPLLMQYPNWIGTYGPNGKWGTSPAYVTERRADKIANAIQEYHEYRGEYPASLSDLFPRYLIYTPRPIMISGQTWCYEGGPDYYRFGYVYRQYFSSSASVRIHATVGEPPNPGWPCDNEAKKYPGPFGNQSP
jgi:hypothetical protein